MVAEETIKKCFRNAGVLDNDLAVVSRGHFLDLDVQLSQQQLDIVMAGNLLIAIGMDEDKWEDNILSQL